MRFVMHRDRVVTTPFGHALGFKKDVPLEVPRICRDLVMAAGADPVEELPEDAEDTNKKPAVAPDDAMERADDIKAACILLGETNDAKSFTAGGTPTVKALTAVLGWKPEADEVATVWAAIKADAAK